MSRRTIIGSILAVVVVGAGFFAFAPKAAIPDYNVDESNVAIHGYDTVAYFIADKALKGKSEFEHVWHDARWQFDSAGNRDLFVANPDRYAPTFGGYCALGLAAGEYADGDPTAWTIVDGKLYLNNTKGVREVWRKAPKAHIGNANYNWEKNRAELRDNL